MKRRRFLIGAGATTSATVAGCLGDDGDEADGGNGRDLEDGDENATAADGGNGTSAAEGDAGDEDGDDRTAENDSSNDDGDDSSNGGDPNEDGSNGDDSSGNDGDSSSDDDSNGNGGDDSSDGDEEVLEDDGGNGGEDDEGGDGHGEDEGSSDSEGDDAGGEDEPETHTLEVEIGAEPGYNRPAEATVSVGDRRLTTDDPLVSFDLEAGTHTLEVSADGFETTTRTVSLEGDSSVTVELPRRYEDIRIVDHEVTVTRREESDDTVEAAVTLENRSDFESTRVWVEVAATDQNGDSFGHAESQATAVSPEGETRVQLTLHRSITDSFENGREVGSYDVTVTTTGTFRVLDSASG